MLGAVRPRVTWALFYPGKDGIANDTAVLSDNGYRLVLVNSHLLSTGRFGGSGPISKETTTISSVTTTTKRKWELQTLAEAEMLET